MAFLLLLLTLLFSLSALAAPDAADPAWRALLHFSGASGGTSSAHAGAPFFLSPNGHEDPAAELAATERYFDEHPDEASCRFPARALYLGRTKEGSSEWCTRWGKWRAAISAKGAELVFAAAYLASPSSMYGHTLIKFVRAGASEGEELLDYTLNYGADTGATVGLPYIYKGLTGGFDGNYATAPFYLKVKDYNFVENRDFWIYPLKLTERELRLLVAHAWELREVKFQYLFLHRNCAFYVLELLETIRPGSGFTSHFPFWTVPVDTIRTLEKSALAGTPRFRASRYRRLVRARNALSGKERALVEELAETATGVLPSGREAAVLDAAYELWRYRYEGQKPPDATVEAKLLDARSHFTDPPFEPAWTEKPPELGHPSSRAYVGGGADRRNNFLELGYRGTLQDLLADSHGYEDFGELSMGDLRLRAENGQVFLERADIMRLRSVAPREQWIPRWSWSFRTGFERAKEFSCTAWKCSAGEMEAGYGASARLGPLVGFVLGEGGVEAGSPFDRGYRVGFGPTGGMFTPLWGGARALAEGSWRFRLLGGRTPLRVARAGVAQTFTRLWEARVTAEVSRGYREGLAQLNFYF